MRGALNQEEYGKQLENLRTYLLNQPEKNHLQEFLQRMI